MKINEEYDRIWCIIQEERERWKPNKKTIKNMKYGLSRSSYVHTRDMVTESIQPHLYLVNHVQ